MAPRPRVEHLTAAERVRWRDLAHHEPVAGSRDDRLLEPDLPEAAAEPRQARGRLAGAVVDLDPLSRLRFTVAELELRVDPIRGTQPRVGLDQHVAALDLRHREAGQVHGHSLARRRPIHLLVVHLHAAHPNSPPLRQHLELVSAPDRPRPERPGDDRAGPPDSEHPVDVEASRRGSAVRPRGDRPAGPVECRPQLLDSLARTRRHGHDLAASEQFGRLDQRDLGIGEVGLGHGHDPGADAQRLEHRSVLAGLRHHTVVGGDRHQKQVDAARARDHRPYKPLVPGNVDHRQPPPRGQLEARVAELDRDPPRPLLREPVGVDSGQRAYQRGLAVIDVAGGSERQRRAHSPASDARAAAATSSTSSSASVRGSSSTCPSWIRAITGGSP